MQLCVDEYNNGSSSPDIDFDREPGHQAILADKLSFFERGDSSHSGSHNIIKQFNPDAIFGACSIIIFCGACGGAAAFAGCLNVVEH